MKENYIPKDERKKILLLSDDLRLNSGVGVMSREIVKHTAHRYNWFQVGAAIDHPEKGKILDVSADINAKMGLTDSNVKILPSDGYGDPDLIRQLIDIEKPDAILHYTDPRFWIWLYNMQHEIRQKIPIFFYSIWDDLPYPKYNKPYYESCDWIGCITKQTYNIVKQVTNDMKPWQVSYIPHGIDETLFYPINSDNTGNIVDIGNGVIKTDYELLQEYKNKEFGVDTEFIVLFNSRNIRRKMVGDVVLAYKHFCKNIGKSADKCLLILNTAAVDQNGTDLPALINAVCPEYKIKITNSKLDNRYLNYLYNIADVTINISSAEGFGLSIAESLMSGTPVIVNVVGGLQDQVGFKDDNDNYLTLEHYTKEWGTNSDGKYKKHGEWAKVVFPQTISLVGSPPTPYIYDSRCRWDAAGDKILEWYNISGDKRKKAGLKGREFLLDENTGMSAKNMGDRFIKDIDTAFQNWKPIDNFELIKL